MNCGDLGIPDPRLLAEHAYTNYKSSSEVMVGSLLGGTNLNYKVHVACVGRSSIDKGKQRYF